MTKKIIVISSDSIVWNYKDVLIQLSIAMHNDQDIIIDLNAEGPDFYYLNLHNNILTMAQDLNYPLDKITIETLNLVESSELFVIKKSAPWHFVKNTRDLVDFKNKEIQYTFGMFIGRSNVHRLLLSSQIKKHNSIQTFHYDRNIDFHRNNLGITSIIEDYPEYIDDAVSLIKESPLKFNDVFYPLLMDQHCNIQSQYSKFFVEVCCETYYSGNTFFPTEKTWRAIATGTPFIIQGPQNYLQNLKKLGFKTFESWWDEGYSEDPAAHQPIEIIKVINEISQWDKNKIDNVYNEMKSSLEHNKKVFDNLTEEDFKKIFNYE